VSAPNSPSGVANGMTMIDLVLTPVCTSTLGSKAPLRSVLLTIIGCCKETERPVMPFPTGCSRARSLSATGECETTKRRDFPSSLKRRIDPSAAVGYAAALAKKHGKIVEHPMQTNGTRLTEARLDLLLKLGIRIGISCDGPPEINDRHRMAGKRVEQALKLLIERRVRVGVILVLSQSNCCEMWQVMEYFRGLGLPAFRVNFMQPQGLGLDHDLLTGREMFAGMKAVFDHMAETNCSVVEADMQMAVNRFVSGRYPRPQLSCWEHQCQAGRVYVAINVEGDVYSCGTDMFHHRLGHIDEGFAREHVGQTLCTLHHKDPWYIRCFNCAAKRICNQSCPTSDFNNINYRDAECEYTRLLYSYFTENAGVVRQVYETIGKRHPEANSMR
jgi:uncharacterized protein